MTNIINSRTELAHIASFTFLDSQFLKYIKLLIHQYHATRDESI